MSAGYKGTRLLSSLVVTQGDAPAVIFRCLLSLGFCSGGLAAVGHQASETSCFILLSKRARLPGIKATGYLPGLVFQRL